MKKKKKEALLFAYQSVYEKYKALNNSRLSFRQLGLVILESHMEALQKVMLNDLKMKIEFKPFPKWKKQPHASE